jgi:hypothetical protein
MKLKLKTNTKVNKMSLDQGNYSLYKLESRSSFKGDTWTLVGIYPTNIEAINVLKNTFTIFKIEYRGRVVTSRVLG